MAIDTSEKLLSVLDMDPTTAPGIPFPWTTLGSGEQRHFLWLYSGDLEATDETDDETPGPELADIVIPIQRWLIRTAHFDQLGQVTVEDCRLSIKRGIGGSATESKIHVRVNRDNKGFGRNITRKLGKAGDRFSTINIGPLGDGHVFQFEVWSTDDCDIELHGIEAVLKKIGN